MNIINFLKKNVEKYPTKIAIIDEDASITFQKLYEEVQKFSTSISFLNEKDVISLISDNSISFVISYLGIINAGKLVHLIPPEIFESNLSTQLEASNSGAIICSKLNKKSFLENQSIKIPIYGIEEVLSNQEKISDIKKNNDLAYLIYTSGTTSDPKGVAVSHKMIDFTTKNIVKVLGYSDSDIDLLPLPLHHSFGLGCVHTSLYTGSTLVLLKNASNLEFMFETLKKFKVTTFAAIPATLTKILKFDRNLLESYFSNIRLIITNSTSIPKNTVQNFKHILVNGNLATYYGLTEASRSSFMIFDEKNDRDESVGKAAPKVEIKIVNDEKNESNLGEIWIKGDNVIKNYWRNYEADKNLIDGWLRTGDIGYFDEEKYLFLKGRNDDIINIGGEKVSPLEIEESVKEILGVDDVAAFGIMHEIFGQTIKINVVKAKDSDLSKSQILSHCIKNLEKYKIPSKIDFVERIPKTDYGKVKRFMLK
ncbi:long-chain-fatty-acid--CoA ligase [Nitrosopumilus zosterae]|uniref:Long-chain-fatty-acid--CoA ligase n=1 Tax=Nitrosopumilus zosterae TaxID=718286 RepID=A0A2S2KU43_9ARCH|nr:class I adenylate-forming enzyme family protein [Nitrosopumilus zosterae]BDQ31812.1 acyl--CoA ligase [Nitrosopumilus zosterae]GBH35162.1 long-chain-fatty-acid--CoA ligase [Nitrosopumilus zosterae]